MSTDVRWRSVAFIVVYGRAMNTQKKMNVMTFHAPEEPVEVVNFLLCFISHEIHSTFIP